MPLQKLVHQFSPGQWLRIAVGSLVLAIGAVLLLLYPPDAQRRERIGDTFDAVELFVRDTIRLSFKSRNPKGFQDIAYVAPKGILDESKTFQWLEDAPELAPAADAPAEVIQAIAPPRLLDPTWIPVFADPLPAKERK